MKDAARGALRLADHFQDSDSYIHHFEFEGRGEERGITNEIQSFEVSVRRIEMVPSLKFETLMRSNR